MWARRGRAEWATMAFAGVAILCLTLGAAPASAASPQTPSGLKGTSPYVSSNVQTSGCTKVSAPTPTIKLPSGVGRGRTSASATTCRAGVGKVPLSSRVFVQSQIGAGRYYTLTKRATSFNVSYSITAKVYGSAAGSTSSCPTTRSHYTSRESNGTRSTKVWVNTTTTFCEAEAMWTLFVGANVCEILGNGGSICRGQLQLVATNLTGNYYENQTTTTNYSRPAVVGRSNSTVTTVVNQSYGATNASVLHLTGTMSFFGTWKKGATIDASGLISMNLLGEIYYESSAYANTMIVANTGGYSLDITNLAFG